LPAVWPASDRRPAPGSGGLEQLDRVAGWILQQDLLAAVAGHDLVAELPAGGLESRDRVWKGID
jgi:hypothetical protein